MSIYVLYHAGCQDGFTAAYVAWKAFGDEAIYIPVQYGEPLPLIPDQSVVYILDFSYKRNVLVELKARMQTLVVLDHHKTAEEELKWLPYAYFNQDECGATMTWNYCFADKPKPELLSYVRDRDLWLWELPRSREVNAALSIQDRTFKHWDELFSYPICDLVEVGKIVLEVQRRQIDGLVKKAYLHDIGGYKVPVVNSPVLQSEIGESLCQDHLFAGIYFWKDECTRIWSLRSRDFDVSAVAKSLGGGGHTKAAGFTEIIS